MYFSWVSLPHNCFAVVILLSRRRNFLAPVELEDLQPISGSLGTSIKDGIESMLVLETNARESVPGLLDQLEGILI